MIAEICEKMKDTDMYLMCRDTKVLKFNLEAHYCKILREELLPYGLRGAIVDGKSTQNYNELFRYFSERTLSSERENFKNLVNVFQLSQARDPISRAEIALFCNNISMTDSFWIDDGKRCWRDINPRNAIWDKKISNIALMGSCEIIKEKYPTSELTTYGTYAKTWVREEDGIYLYKKSTPNGNESEKEVSVSSILDCMNVLHVKYMEAFYDGCDIFLCKCKNMCNDDVSIITAEEYKGYCNRIGKDYKESILNIDEENIYKMCVVDYLISNSDRHGQNWGFFVDNNTGLVIGCHPLFDHNNSFDEKDMLDKDGGRSLIFEGYSKREVAEYAAKKYHFLINGKLKRSMFLNKKMYESFAERACGLNLCESKNIFKKIK